MIPIIVIDESMDDPIEYERKNTATEYVANGLVQFNAPVQLKALS
jgi:hypothetical protein